MIDTLEIEGLGPIVITEVEIQQVGPAGPAGPNVITELILAGTNVTFAGSGTLTSPYIVSASSAGGDMLASVYDPTSIAGDAFARENHTGAQASSTITNFAAEVAATASVTANTAKTSNANHTGDVTGATALTIANNVVTNAKAADMATGRIKARLTAGEGDPEDSTLAAVRTAMALDQINLSGAGIAPPNIPSTLVVAGITTPVAYDPDVDLNFHDFDIAGLPEWRAVDDDLEIKVLGGRWYIATRITTDYQAWVPYNNEASPVGLTGWTVDEGVGNPTVTGNATTPTRAGEIIRYGAAPYRYFVANSTTIGDYAELTDATELRYVTHSGGGLTLNATNCAPKVIRSTGADAFDITVTADQPTGRHWIVRQAGAGVGTTLEPTGGSLNGDKYKTAGQHTMMSIEHVGGNALDFEGGAA